MLTDSYHRQINYLRLSITDMCNLQCIYCQSWKEIGKKSHQEILRYEEIIRLAGLMAQLGIRRVRITGGEPLLKKDVMYLIEELVKLGLFEELRIVD
ncbi:MAG: radical SAM protein [bacterium]